MYKIVRNIYHFGSSYEEYIAYIVYTSKICKRPIMFMLRIVITFPIFYFIQNYY